MESKLGNETNARSMIHVLDTYQLGRAGIIASTALETNEGFVLFDVGPESTYENILEQLRVLGANAKDVRHVFLSHIHFDHAGAAWRFAKERATIYVHPRGAPHLIDPSRLVESATRIFGEEMEKLWGKFSDIAPEKIRVLEDGDQVMIDSLGIRAHATPGHASHHHVYHWNENLFGGDVAGVRIGNGPPIPPFVPPELDVEAWLQSIDKMRELNAEKLYLPHFGLAPGPVAEHFDGLEKRVRAWSDWFRERANEDEQQLIKRFADYEHDDLREHSASEDEVADYERADPSAMAVTAALRYWRKRNS